MLIGDCDAERGVLYYDYPSGNFGALSICDLSPNANDFYYSIAVHYVGVACVGDSGDSVRERRVASGAGGASGGRGSSVFVCVLV